MKRAVKIVLFIVLGMAAYFGFIILILNLDNFAKSNRLDFGYEDYLGNKKTPPLGQVEPISLDKYKKVDILEHLGECEIFPDDLPVGEASMMLSYDPLYQHKTNKRGQVFLEWEMPSDIFNSELNRMKELKVFDQVETKTIWSNDLFDLPSCIASYNALSYFEYALLDEEACVIRYVHFFDIESLDNVLFPIEWAPKRLIKDSDVKDYALSDGSYSIYII